MSLEAPDLSRYFTHGHTYRDIGTTIIGDAYDEQNTITVEPLGELAMPSGRFVVCDPMMLGSDLPFLDEQVPPGSYPVSVSRLTTADTGHACIVDAAANEAFGDETWDSLQDASDHWRAVPAVITEPITGHAVAVTRSGAGDGMYPFWLGRDADGKVACVVTTFLHDLQ